MSFGLNFNNRIELIQAFNARVVNDAGAFEDFYGLENSLKTIIPSANIIKLLTPFYFSKNKLITLIEVLLSQLQFVVIAFKNLRVETDFKARYSCQQRAFKSLLNRFFEDTRNGKSFSILTTADLKPVYFAPISTEESGLAAPLYAGLGTEPHAQPIFAGLASEYNEPVSFIVYAPIECKPQEKEIISWVNYYRFVSKNFRIVYT